MRDRSATGALVLGLLCLPFGILSPFAIWSGARALQRIRKSNGALRGGATATIGLIAGVIGLVSLVFGVTYWLLAR
jgi:Domain of unknown function (DUF4190)